jgi:magnesium transporter
MLKKFNYKDILWIDLESPTETELNELGATYNLHPVVLAELNAPSARSKVDLYNDFIYLIFHFPDETKTQEVDFVIGKDFIITTHYEMINPLNDFAKIFETDFVLKKSQEKLHAGFIFFYIIRELYNSLENDLHLINDKLKKVESGVFSGKEREVVKQLTEINRELLDCQWTLRPHEEILASLQIAGEEMFGKKFSYYLRAISGEYERIWSLVENNKATFLALRETNDSLLSIKANEIMRLLTVAAFVFLPMTVIPQVFGMNIQIMPFLTHPSGFWIVLILMAAASFLLYLIARLKKWF